jgi:integrase
MTESGTPKLGSKGYVSIPQKTVTVLRRHWMETPWKDHTNYVFTTLGPPVSRNRINEILQAGAKKAKVQTHITSHTLRHAYNTYARSLFLSARLGEDLLRTQTRHKSRGMTDYYDHPDEEELKRRLAPIHGVLDELV